MAMNRKRAELLFHVSTFANFLTYPAQLIASILDSGVWASGEGSWRVSGLEQAQPYSAFYLGLHSSVGSGQQMQLSLIRRKKRQCGATLFDSPRSPTYYEKPIVAVDIRLKLIAYCHSTRIAVPYGRAPSASLARIALALPVQARAIANTVPILRVYNVSPSP